MASNIKFCSECGSNLVSVHENAQTLTPTLPENNQRDSFATDQEEIEPVKINVYDLGVRLEETVASIFEKMGYTAERRKRVPTRSGATAEIDIVLTRGNRRKAVECKNYDTSRAVGVSDLRVFKDKLADTGIISGTFITNTVFSEDAEKLAESTGIELWDGDELREKFFSYSIGRIGNPSLVQDPVLPLQQDFTSASNLSLRNSQAVNLFSAVLLYHPYVIVKYRLRSVRNDPTRHSHVITDDGTYFVDALDGDIINRERSVLESMAGLFKNKERRVESKEDKIVSEDIMTLKPISQPILTTSDYQTSVAEPSVSEEEAVKLVKNYVVEKNTQNIKYKIKIRGELETRSFKVVPRLNEVDVRGQKLVYVPKWDLQYEIGNRSFERRSIASSDRSIEDALSKCEKCTLLKKTPIAICEVCGAPLCEKHSYQEGGKWLCEDHVSASLSQQIKQKGFFSKFRGK